MATGKPMTEAELLALPVSVDIETAGRAFGMGRSKSYEAARMKAFPCPVLPLGRSYRVTKAAIMAALGYEYGDNGWRPVTARQDAA